ncbi:leptin receptor-like isoform X2 [Anguilla anguilla]|uniref:leptin receptor-like isoform X2 n=1 Tax=Anguilla anguilla TaxID=7936 RepID=UPI0015ADC75F|nr:leptin receptor-like isoform X2 [Anguilla anguilla]
MHWLNSFYSGSFSAKGMFAVSFLLTLHGVVAVHSAVAPPPEFEYPGKLGLCCYLGDGWAEETGGGNGEGDNSRDGMGGGSLGHTPPGRCSVSSPARFRQSALTSQNHSGKLRVVCLDVLCWVTGDRRHLVCERNPRGGNVAVGGVVTLTLLRLQSDQQMQATPSALPDGVTHSCQEEGEGVGVFWCALPPGSMRDAVTLRVNVARGNRSALSPEISFVPQKLVRPDPPVKLWYNMTTEGELRLHWTPPQPATGPLTYDVRYSSNTSLNSWVHVNKVITQPVTLTGMNAGVTYTVQVRCKILGKPGLWSEWSQSLFIYLHEVTYLPKSVFTSEGANVTVYCIFNNQSLSARNVVWWLNIQEKVPESLYTIVNDRVSRVTVPNVRPLKRQQYNVLQCCQRSGETSLCSYRYASLYTDGVSVAISCETNGDLSAMTCRWNISLGVRFYYRTSDVPFDIAEEQMAVSKEEECPSEGRGLKSCTFQPFLPFSYYMMWLEFGTEEGTVKSQPVYALPMDLVKPYPPFDLEAVTVPEGYLRATWKRPELPTYDLLFEVRYAVDGPDPLWRVYKSEVNLTVVFPVSDPCAVYTIMVRCKRLHGSGFWSEWSDPHYSAVQISRAPERGPDFWRVLKDDRERNQSNVTLLFAPLTGEGTLCCVTGIVVQHQTTGGAVWIEQLGLVSTYTFPWREEVHTVTVMAINSLGPSTRNTHMTLMRKASKPRSVSSFSSVMINDSCVALVWSLFPNSSAPASFVVEWSSRSRGRGRGDAWLRVKWVRVSAPSRSLYLHDRFYVSEEYQFALHPIFANGEGEPFYNKDRGRPSAQHAAYALLLIIAFMSVVLFLTLAASQRQMMKLVWKDVPNPNNCSWAQGVDFRKAEAVENLFRHPERSCPLLLEMETISEAVIVEKAHPKAASEKDRAAWAEKALRAAVTPFSSAGSSAQSSVAYATVLPAAEGGRARRRPQESLSSCSDEGNFSADTSDMSGSYPGALWEPEGMPSNPRHPCHSCASTEEFSENSDQEDQSLDGTGSRQDLYYLGTISQSEEGEEGKPFHRESTLGRCLESSPLLGQQEPWSHGEERSGKGVPLYMPQFQTVVTESQSTKGL